MSTQTVIRKPIRQGTTPRISFQIVDEDQVGFQPDALTMTIYDHVCVGDEDANTFINDRDADDVLASCDASGNVELWLEEDDTAVADLDNCAPKTTERTVLFRWTWDSPEKVGKHQVVFTIESDYATVAE